MSIGQTQMPKASALVRALAGATVIAVALAGALPVSAQGKSGLGPDHVILPTGPGSVNGVGPDYDPDLPNGSATLDIEIVVPRGVAGFNPELSLSYDSGNGNGIFGFGWDMGLYTVERRSSIPLPRYVDDVNGIDDDFDGVVDNEEEIDQIRAFSGGWPINLIAEDDLDPEDDLEPQGDGFFFTSIESDFVRYKKKEDNWCGAKPDGYVFEFGLTDQARIMAPDDPSKVFTWLIEKEFDLSGNLIEYFYERSTADGSNAYISRIQWGVGGENIARAAATPRAKVKVQREKVRLRGKEARTAKALPRVREQPMGREAAKAKVKLVDHDRIFISSSLCMKNAQTSMRAWLQAFPCARRAVSRASSWALRLTNCLATSRVTSTRMASRIS